MFNVINKVTNTPQQIQNKNNYQSRPVFNTPCDTVSFGNKTNFKVVAKMAKPIGIEAFLKNFESIFGNLEFESKGGYLESKIDLPANQLKKVQQFNSRIEERYNNILLKAKPEQIKKFVVDLLKHKEKFPYIISQNGSKVRLEEKGFAIVGAEHSHFGHCHDLQYGNPEVYQFISEGGLSKTGNLLIHDKKPYLIETVYDNGGKAIGVVAKPQRLIT